ncbi:MAG: hypothetical protein K1X79_07595 [Oligoflexia bacterium]|nr:hypothetical protein [Oligoflexia bacterium]
MRRCAPLLTLLVLFLGAYYRRPDAITLPQLWAEDGTMFFRQAHELGAQSLLLRYAGYYHGLVRLLAWLGNLLVPTASIPSWYNLCALIALLGLGLKLHSERLHRVVPALPFALGLTLAPVYNEPFLNLTNMQWILALYVLLYLVAKPASKSSHKMSDFFDVVVLGLSGPFVIFFLPLFWLRAWVNRRLFDCSRYERCIFGLAHIVASIQLAGMDSARVSGEASWMDFDYVRVFARTVAMAIFGPGGDTLGAQAYSTVICCALTLLLLYLGLSAYCRRRENWSALTVLWAGILVWLAVFISIRNQPGILVGGGERYFFIQGVTLVWSLMLLWRELPVFSGGCLTLLLASFLLHAPAYKNPPLINKHWKRASRCVGKKYPCLIQINPQGWSVYLSKGA